MSAISEEEAEQYPDLYRFETNCIDFLRSMKHLKQADPNYTLEDAIGPAKEMQAFLVRSLAALDNLTGVKQIDH